jgi:DNA repair exonuclease SbcCD ATPase subunit
MDKLKIKDLDIELEREYTKYQQDLGRAKQIAERGKELQTQFMGLESLDITLRKVSALFRSMSEERQDVLRERIERLVSLGLKAVFQEPFVFYIKMVPKADQITAQFILLDGHGVEADVLNSRGGGISAVVGVLLQIVMLSFMRSRVDQVLFLDEALAHLSDEYTTRMGMLLKMLSKRLGIQVIMVTHQPEFMEFADITYKLTAPKGATIAERIK